MQNTADRFRRATDRPWHDKSLDCRFCPVSRPFRSSTRYPAGLQSARYPVRSEAHPVSRSRRNSPIIPL